jgi:hypothetical protein
VCTGEAGLVLESEGSGWLEKSHTRGHWVWLRTNFIPPHTSRVDDQFACETAEEHIGANAQRTPSRITIVMSAIAMSRLPCPRLPP